MLRRCLLLVAMMLTVRTVTGGEALATLEGLITDHLGEPVVNTQLEIRQVFTGETRNERGNDAGYYRVEQLKPGRYNLLVQAPGHGCGWYKDIVLSAGEVKRRDVVLIKGKQGAIPTAACEAR